MSNVNKNDAAQVAVQPTPALSDDALNVIAGGYDPYTAAGLAYAMVNNGAIEPEGNNTKEDVMRDLMNVLTHCKLNKDKLAEVLNFLNPAA